MIAFRGDPPVSDHDPRTDQRRGAWFYVPAAALAAVAWAVHTWSFGHPWYGMDDAYIVAHNAQVLHWGHDPNYTGTPALAGSTSPVYLALVALLLTEIPLPWTLDVAGWLAAGAFVIGGAHLARVARVSALWSFVLVVTAAVLAEMPHQLTNGLETGLMLAVVTWAIALHIDARRRADASGRAADAGCLLSGLMPFVRPDLAHFAFLLAGANLVLRRRAAASFRASVPNLVRGAGFFAAAVLPWVI